MDNTDGFVKEDGKMPGGINPMWSTVGNQGRLRAGEVWSSPGKNTPTGCLVPNC